MALTFYIPPETFKTIIDWQQVSFLNNIRAIIFLIGCAFVPGSSLYKIFFNDNNFHEKFQIESFLLKLTFYPLISFMFLGLSTLILDSIGLLRNQFPLLSCQNSFANFSSVFRFNPFLVSSAFNAATSSTSFFATSRCFIFANSSFCS